MWALGAVVYEMLHNVPAFHGDTLNDIEIRIRSPAGHSAISKLASAAARSIVSQLLTIEPSSRPSAREVLEHPWLKPSAVGVVRTFGPIPGRTVAQADASPTDEDEGEDEEEEGDDEVGDSTEPLGNQVLKAHRTEARAANSEELSRKLEALYASDGDDVAAD